MLATFCLLTCALATAQPQSRADWLLTPHLVRGQELVYSGSWSEEALSPGVQFHRSYKVETTLLVFEATAQKNEVALFTVLSLRTKQVQADAAGPWSVRLEIVEVTPQGKVRGPANLIVPLEGPPTVEWGALVERPSAGFACRIRG